MQRFFFSPAPKWLTQRLLYMDIQHMKKNGKCMQMRNLVYPISNHSFKGITFVKHGQIFMTQLCINGPFQKKSNMPSRLLKLQAPPSETIVPQVFIDISTLIWKYDIYMRISMCIYGPWASILQRTNHSIPDHTMAVGRKKHITHSNIAVSSLKLRCVIYKIYKIYYLRFNHIYCPSWQSIKYLLNQIRVYEQN